MRYLQSGRPPARTLVVTTIGRTNVRFLVPHAAALTAAGWRVHAAAADATHHPELQFAYEHCYDIRIGRRPTDALLVIRAARQIRSLVRRNRYSILHLHTPIAAAAGRLAVLFVRPYMKPKVVYTVHGFHFTPELSRGLERSLYRLIERALAGLTDAYITMNSADYEVARGLSRGRAIVRNGPGVGLPVEEFGARIEAEKRCTPPPEIAKAQQGSEAVLVTVGELNPGKRYDDAIRAAGEFAAASELRLSLVLIGDGPERARLEALASHYPQLSTTFVGRSDSIESYLAHADLFVHPSEREGLPRAVLEAMAAGLPVVGYDVRGVRDLLGDVCPLAPLGDVKELSELIGLWTRREAPSDAIRTRALSFSLEAAVRVTLETYTEVSSS